MVYAKVVVTTGYGDTYTQIYPLSDLHNVVEDVAIFAEEDPDATWTLEYVEMTEEEYDELPEFTGY